MGIIILSAILFYIGFGLYLYIRQRSYLYEPTPEMPSKFPLIKIRSGLKLIRVLMVNRMQPNAIIYFGGNAEQVNKNASHFNILFPRHTSYLVHYRGYGGSKGRPTEANIYKDALAVYNYVQTKHNSISIIGRSLGSGVATYVAAHKPVTRLVLVTPFDSVESIAQAIYPWYPISWMLIDKFDSISRASMIKAPTLIILTEHDDIVPHSHSLKLAKAFAPYQVTLQLLPNTTHTRLNISGTYGNLLREFLEPTATII
jgi:hypothetical protein